MHLLFNQQLNKKVMEKSKSKVCFFYSLHSLARTRQKLNCLDWSKAKKSSESIIEVLFDRLQKSFF